jgi:hypothetical protein
MGPPRPVATGLNNPRHLIVENGKVWVAEAGVGGDLQCIISPEGEQCIGRTGAITTIDRTGRVRRVVEGLPSLATPFDGSYGTGTADISLTGTQRSDGRRGRSGRCAVRDRAGRGAE